MFKNKNQVSQTPESVGTLAEELQKAEKSAVRLWKEVHSGGAGLKSLGFGVAFDKRSDKASIMLPVIKGDPRRGAIALSFDKDGIWHVEKLSQTPNYEQDAISFAKVWHVTDYSLAEDKDTISMRTLHREGLEGAPDLIEVTNVQLNDPLDAVHTHALGLEMQGLADRAAAQRIAIHATQHMAV